MRLEPAAQVGERREVKRFAFFPVTTVDYQRIWLEFYTAVQVRESSIEGPYWRTEWRYVHSKS